MTDLVEACARALAKSFFQRGYERDPAFYEMKFRETGDPTWNDADAYADDRCKWPEFQTDARAVIPVVLAWAAEVARIKGDQARKDFPMRGPMALMMEMRDLPSAILALKPEAQS